jgi:hypothetical protein
MHVKQSSLVWDRCWPRLDERQTEQGYMSEGLSMRRARLRRIVSAESVSNTHSKNWIMYGVAKLRHDWPTSSIQRLVCTRAALNVASRESAMSMTV